MFAGDLLHTGRLGQAKRHQRLSEDRPQMAIDLISGLVDAQARKLHATVCRAKIDRSLGLDLIVSRDRLVDQRAGDNDLKVIERVNLVGRFGNNFDRIDEDNIGRLDNIGRQGNWVKLRRHGICRHELRIERFSWREHARAAAGERAKAHQQDDCERARRV